MINYGSESKMFNGTYNPVVFTEEAIFGIDAGRGYCQGEAAGNYVEFISYCGLQPNFKREPERDSDDLFVTYEGRNYLVGKTAKKHLRERAKNLGENKVTIATKIQILTMAALLGASRFPEVKIYTCVPFLHFDSQAPKLQRDLQGRHEIIVNGQLHIINITRCGVYAEGEVITFLLPLDFFEKHERVRVIDPGAKDTTLITIDADGDLVDYESDVLNEGWETGQNDDPEFFASVIQGHMGRLGWETRDLIIVMGGRAEDLLEPLKSSWGYGRAVLPPSTDPRRVNSLGCRQAGIAELNEDYE